MNWNPHSWKSKKQSNYIPRYENKDLLNKNKNILKHKRHPIVFANEINELKKDLKKVAEEDGFIIQGGDCAEIINGKTTSEIIDLVKLLSEMSLIYSYSTNKPVVKIGRIAGQYAKPRSSMYEKKDGLTLPSYFGDIVNGFEFSEASRKIDPSRLVEAHDSSVSVMNTLRALMNSSYLSLDTIYNWTNDDTLYNDLNINVYDEYSETIKSIKDSILFAKNCGCDDVSFNNPVIYTSHEALLLDYEECLVRTDSKTGNMYDCSAHFIWLGERTREIDGAHVEFLRGIDNPIGIKVGPKANHEELIDIIRKLKKKKKKGKISLICRFGEHCIEQELPILLSTLKENPEINHLLMIDPMHGNTKKIESGIKTRDFRDVLIESSKFFKICKDHNVKSHGIHLELTAEDDSAECIGGLIGNDVTDIEHRYNSNCDPRLNRSQCIEYILLLSKHLT
jgi:3-deoxy-7-phosphoheptulonate synthase